MKSRKSLQLSSIKFKLNPEKLPLFFKVITSVNLNQIIRHTKWLRKQMQLLAEIHISSILVVCDLWVDEKQTREEIKGCYLLSPLIRMVSSKASSVLQYHTFLLQERQKLEMYQEWKKAIFKAASFWIQILYPKCKEMTSDTWYMHGTSWKRRIEILPNKM